MNIHCEFSSRFHSDSKRIRSGFESKRRESPRIHNVFAQQYGFANFGRVFTVIRCETLSWATATSYTFNCDIQPTKPLVYRPLRILLFSLKSVISDGMPQSKKVLKTSRPTSKSGKSSTTVLLSTVRATRREFLIEIHKEAMSEWV